MGKVINNDAISYTKIEQIAKLFCDYWLGEGSYQHCKEDEKERMKNVAEQAYMIARTKMDL